MTNGTADHTLELLRRMDGKLDAMNERIDSMRKDMVSRFDKADGELQAIRNVVDDDLASYEQVLTLESKMTDVQKTVRQHGKMLKERI